MGCGPVLVSGSGSVMQTKHPRQVCLAGVNAKPIRFNRFIWDFSADQAEVSTLPPGVSSWPGFSPAGFLVTPTMAGRSKRPLST